MDGMPHDQTATRRMIWCAHAEGSVSALRDDLRPASAHNAVSNGLRPRVDGMPRDWTAT